MNIEKSSIKLDIIAFIRQLQNFPFPMGINCKIYVCPTQYTEYNLAEIVEIRQSRFC